MRFLIVTPYVGVFEVGGGKAVARELASEMARKGHAVTILAPALKDADIPTQGGVAISLVKSVFRPDRFTFPISLTRIMHLAKSADWIYVHPVGDTFALSVFLLSVVVNRKISVAVIGLLDILGYPRRYMRILRLPLIFPAIPCLLLSRSIHAKNQLERRRLGKIFGSKVKLIPDGLPDAYFKPHHGADRNGEVERGRGFRLLYVGRLHPVKGITALLQHWKPVADKFPDMELMVVGPDRQGTRDKVERIVSSQGLCGRVSLLGCLGETDKIAILDSADAVIIPSLYDMVEAFSLVASEAWARHKPVLASAVGALRVRVAQGKDGFFIDPRDPSSIIRGIQWAKEHPTVEPPSDVVPWSTVFYLMQSELFK